MNTSPTPAFDLSLPVGNIAAYLVQSLNADGSPPVLTTGSRWLTSADTLTWRKRDYPGAGAYAADGVLCLAGWATTWQETPFDASAPWGGELFTYDSGAVQARITQDGGTPGIQYFIGPDGWMICDVNPPFGTWAGKTILLADAPSPTTPYTAGGAYLRWRREVLSVLFTIFGVEQQLLLPCIISEHFSTVDTVANATEVEQSIYALGWGQIWWAAYGPVPAGGAPDLSANNPRQPWPAPPEHPEWVMQSCRLWTNVTKVASIESNTIGWTPAT